MLDNSWQQGGTGLESSRAVTPKREKKRVEWQWSPTTDPSPPHDDDCSPYTVDYDYPARYPSQTASKRIHVPHREAISPPQQRPQQRSTSPNSYAARHRGRLSAHRAKPLPPRPAYQSPVMPRRPSPSPRTSRSRTPRSRSPRTATRSPSPYGSYRYASPSMQSAWRTASPTPPPDAMYPYHAPPDPPYDSTPPHPYPNGAWGAPYPPPAPDPTPYTPSAPQTYHTPQQYPPPSPYYHPQHQHHHQQQQQQQHQQQPAHPTPHWTAPTYPSPHSATKAFPSERRTTSPRTPRSSQSVYVPPVKYKSTLPPPESLSPPLSSPRMSPEPPVSYPTSLSPASSPLPPPAAPDPAQLQLPPPPPAPLPGNSPPEIGYRVVSPSHRPVPPNSQEPPPPSPTFTNPTKYLGWLRGAVLAEVRDSWDNPDGLPTVVAGVKNSLGLRDFQAAVEAIEAVLCKRFPQELLAGLDLVASARPHCPDGTQCTKMLAKDEHHMDAYKHPCLRYYETGTCPMYIDYRDRNHVQAHSHFFMRHMEAHPTAPTPPHLGYSARSTSPQTVYGGGDSGLRDTTSSFTSQQYCEKPGSPVKESWRRYWEGFLEKSLDKMVSVYADTSILWVHYEAEGMTREHRGVGNIRRYLSQLLGRLRSCDAVTCASAPMIEEAKDTGVGQVFVTWHCHPSGYSKCTDTISFDSRGRIIRHSTAVNYSRPPPPSRRASRSGSNRPPPIPFSDDVRLRGKPLSGGDTPPYSALDSPPQHNMCSRAVCPRPASPVQDDPPRSRRASTTSGAMVELSEEEAATKIQAHFRGHLARRRTEEKSGEVGPPPDGNERWPVAIRALLINFDGVARHDTDVWGGAERLAQLQGMWKAARDARVPITLLSTRTPGAVVRGCLSSLHGTSRIVGYDERAVFGGVGQGAVVREVLNRQGIYPADALYIDSDPATLMEVETACPGIGYLLTPLPTHLIPTVTSRIHPTRPSPLKQSSYHLPSNPSFSSSSSGSSVPTVFHQRGHPANASCETILHTPR